jgi:hypothetical protein
VERLTNGNCISQSNVKLSYKEGIVSEIKRLKRQGSKQEITDHGNTHKNNP